MANGSYEVVIWVDNGLGAIGKPFWVKPEDIYYEIDMEHNDKIENYFEFIFDENGLHIIPKNIDLINIEVDKDGLKEIVFFHLHIFLFFSRAHSSLPARS